MDIAPTIPRELVFDREAIHDSLKQDLKLKTTKVISFPEGDAELPDDCLPDEIEDDADNDTEEED